MSRSELGGSNAKKVETLRSLRGEALRLPDPSETWPSIEYDISKKAIQKFHRAGIVSREGWERAEIDESDSDAGTYERRVWRTDCDAYTWIRANLTEVRECPAPDCHATGMRNPRDTDGYRCTNDECDRELTRDEARELVR